MNDQKKIVISSHAQWSILHQPLISKFTAKKSWKFFLRKHKNNRVYEEDPCSTSSSNVQDSFHALDPT